tara:strand:+ start:3258 stop:4229 length:972 start_codon:yes stop_codon:yes gene_type:complete
MKLGVWHESIVGKARKEEQSFNDYATQYVKFIKDNNIERAFFLLQDPHIALYVKNGWLEKYWLNKLPTTCEAGLVFDTEPAYPWYKSSKIFEEGDSMEIAFTILANINKTSTHKVTCIGFDYENVKAYYSQQGKQWIESLWKKHVPTLPLDYGFNPSSVKKGIQGNKIYPEAYWVGEMADCGCKADKGPKCQCPITPYCVFNGDPNGLLNTALGKYLEANKGILSLPNVWTMFSTEALAKTDCVASPYGTNNVCGILDAFGSWSKKDFLAFLDVVETKYGIKQAMIYEWNYVPNSWLNKPTPPPLTNGFINFFKRLLCRCCII